VIPRDGLATLQHLAGVESPLAKKHRVHLQHVGVANLRLAEIAPGMCERLRIFALDAHDLALSKLARNNPIDRHDVAQLAKAVPLDPNLLRRRYREAPRPIIIGDIERSDRTLEMWIEAYFGS
jgi:hypothetical protein